MSATGGTWRLGLIGGSIVASRSPRFATSAGADSWAWIRSTRLAFSHWRSRHADRPAAISRAGTDPPSRRGVT